MSDGLNGSKILIVEDEESLAIGLEYNLTEEGYIIKRAADGRQAMEMFSCEKFDLIILDIMLPFYNGFEVADFIRDKDPQIPILMLTARGRATDRVHGLEAGADDYLTKPFHLEELLLRVRGMLKRKAWYKDITAKRSTATFGGNSIDFHALVAQTPTRSFKLTLQEAMVLRYLVENKGRVVSRKELLENVWKINTEIETRTVDNFIVRLRKYFEPNPSKPVYIKSVRSAGYIFDDEIE
ncbi:response regulator transcription factor [candidate division KSB1 bacterium]|nr:response regulator transcription factor [candidate division KSB1 bacterium]